MRTCKVWKCCSEKSLRIIREGILVIQTNCSSSLKNFSLVYITSVELRWLFLKRSSRGLSCFNKEENMQSITPNSIEKRDLNHFFLFMLVFGRRNLDSLVCSRLTCLSIVKFLCVGRVGDRAWSVETRGSSRWTRQIINHNSELN